MGRVRLGELLVQAGLIDELQLTRALGEQQQWGKRLGHTLLDLGFVSEDDLIPILARQLEIPAIRLKGKRIDPEVLELVPAELARKYRCLPLFVKRRGGIDELYLGMDDPRNLAAIDDLSFRTGRHLHPVLIGPCELERSIERFYGTSASADVAAGGFTEAPLEAGDTAPFLTGLPAETFTPLEDEDTQPTTPKPKPPPEVTTRAILRALTELLIEKGVVGRGELVERIRGRKPTA